MRFILFTLSSRSNIKVDDKFGKHRLNDTRKKIISEMRHNPNITKTELVILIGISNTAIDNNMKYLRENGYIERIGGNKN